MIKSNKLKLKESHHFLGGSFDYHRLLLV